MLRTLAVSLVLLLHATLALGQEPATAQEPVGPPPAPTAEEPEPAALASPPEIHGFVSQGFIKTTANDYLARSERGSFEFTEVGVNLTKPLSDDLRVGIQFFARDLGPIGDYKPQVDWFYLDYRFADWLGLRAGRTKLPFGLYNETSDIDAARVPVLLPQSVYPTRSRDFLLAQTGGELYGDIPLGEGGSLEYRAYGGTVFVDTSSATNTIASSDVPYLVGGRLMWQTPAEGLQMGGSVQALRLDFDYIPPPAQIAQLQADGTLPPAFAGTVALQLPVVLWVGSVEYAVHDFLFAAEYARWVVDLKSQFPVILPGSHTVSERGYVMGSYHVTPKFAPGLYYSVLFPNVSRRSLFGSGPEYGRADYQYDIAATLRYDLTNNWLVKLEGHYMHGTAALDPAFNRAPLATLTRNWGLFLIKTTAYF
jgi:hypothetical protein